LRPSIQNATVSTNGAGSVDNSVFEEVISPFRLPFYIAIVEAVVHDGRLASKGLRFVRRT
jgi:hypothetical protein